MIDTSLLYLYVNASDLLRCAASSVPEFTAHHQASRWFTRLASLVNHREGW
jgi:hypothetical protein